MDIAGEFRVRVLNLEMLLVLKEEAARPKDVAVLPLIRDTLHEIRRRKKKDESDPEGRK